MAQIFASERSSMTRPPSRTPATVGNTAPERALAGLQAKADQSGPTARLSQLQGLGGPALQRMEEDELQGKFKGGTAQRIEDEEMLQGKAIQRMEEEEMLQGKAIDGTALQRQESGAVSQGGMPRNLQSGIEQLSGSDLSGVNVHYNSSAPAEVGAHAFAQGNDIHLASGQEQHLPHEAWHVVQQKEGRVQPTIDVAGMPVNDDPGLEKEADVMGAKASQMVSRENHG